MSQLLAQLAQFADASLDQGQFVLQQLSHGAVRIAGMPDRGNAAANLAAAEGAGRASSPMRMLASRKGLTLEHTPGFSLCAP
ncbi:hypothetical protein A3218_09225 [Pseudomonas chlororaphis]|nr:hypothetical protein A3218_09225 [Pseudomonas chlororaphis]